MKFDIIGDPSHCWVKVPKALLIELGIADKISGYSYVRGDYVYLEEDCDASLFIKVAGEAGKAIEFRERYSEARSRVRGYQRYEALEKRP